ncbi:MAG TPA: hypothetical protein VM432_07100, partial [Bdellovibrionales bacterium]|nr:hypothetical protein [Bdellovibrionales bacterium]
MLPQSPILKKLTLALTVSFCLGYAWLGTRAGEPGDRVPRSYVEDVFVIHDQNVYSLGQLHGFFFREMGRTLNELNGIEATVQQLGRLKKKIAVVVDMDRPLRLVTTGDRITIGSEIVRAPGQLAKAVLKAWLLQNGREELKTHLRLEVLSDVLLALNEGGLDLSVPRMAPATFDQPKHWTHYAETYSDLCRSQWLAVDLRGLCKANTAASSNAPTFLAFRPLIGEMIWQSFQTLSVHKRVIAVRKWMRSLRDTQIENEIDVEADSIPSRIEGELLALAPQLKIDTSPLSREMDLDLLVAVQDDAGIYAKDAVPLLAGTKSLVVNGKDYLVSKSGAAVPRSELTVTAKTLALVGCTIPSVGEAVKSLSDFKRVVFIRSCAGDAKPSLHLASL